MDKLFGVATNEEVKLIVSLIECVKVARAWHGVAAFDIYYNHSPEMRIVRETLAKYGIKITDNHFS